MHSHYRCEFCFRSVRARLVDLVEHCNAFHYGQSPDLIFPGHELSYKPMDPLLKHELVARGERRMGKALIGSIIAPVITFEKMVIEHSPERHVAAAMPPTKPQMRPVYGSDAWEQLVCQNWVTIATELSGNQEIAVMEQF